MSLNDETPRSQPRRGPRGGKTTVSRDGAMVRKTFYLDWDVEEALRNESHETRRTEAEILRQILRDHYDIE